MTDTIETLRAQIEQLRAALSDALSVANDCQQRWSRGHPARVERASLVLDSVGGAIYPTDTIQNLAAAERSRDELGIQLAAQSERLRLAMACVKDVDALLAALTRLRPYRIGDIMIAEDALRRSRAALDAVPGDALAKDHAAALDRAHEASGVVTGAPFDEPQNGVKGVE